ncbi:MAG: hypothetical protein H0M93_01280 [Methanophagales archaeon]|nr:hypothetical protein [Methanophagales archaeon]
MYPVREKALRKRGGCCKRRAKNIFLISYIKEKKLEDEIRPVPMEVLREFLVEDVEHVRPSHDWVYSENITFEVSASV